MIYGIHITAAAGADVESIHSFISGYSPEYADRTIDGIEESIELLRTWPHRYALAPEAQIHGKQVRHMVIGKYRIIYMVIIETVNILRIRHTSQPPLGPGELN